MAKPELDRCFVNEAEDALGGLALTDGHAAGALQILEAPLNEVYPAS
jgi:hypothetical protein